MREGQLREPHAGRAGREDGRPHQDTPVRLLVADEATGDASRWSIGSGSNC